MTLKKLICALLTLTLLASFAAPAEEIEKYDWSDYEPSLETLGFEGDFYRYDNLGFRMWVPGEMTQADVSDEQAEEGWKDIFVNEDQSYSMVVQYGPIIDDVTDLGSLKDALEGQYDEATLYTINGLGGLMVLRDGGKTTTLILHGEDDGFVQITCNGVNEERYSKYAFMTMVSVQPL